jgi:hypothetical protein
VLDHLLVVVAAVVEGRGEELAEQAIGEKASRDDRKRGTQDAPNEKEERGDRDRADDEIGRRRVPGAGHELAVELPLVKSGQKGEHAGGP